MQYYTFDFTGELQINQNARHHHNCNDGYCRKHCNYEHFDAKQFDNVCIVNGNWFSHWTWFYAIDTRAWWRPLIVSRKSLILVLKLNRCALGSYLTHLKRFVAFSSFGSERILRIGISVIDEEWNINIFNWIAHILVPPFWRTRIRIIQSTCQIHGVSTSGRYNHMFTTIVHFSYKFLIYFKFDRFHIFDWLDFILSFHLFWWIKTWIN